MTQKNDVPGNNKDVPIGFAEFSDKIDSIPEALPLRKRALITKLLTKIFKRR